MPEVEIMVAAFKLNCSVAKRLATSYTPHSHTFSQFSTHDRMRIRQSKNTGHLSYYCRTEYHRRCGETVAEYGSGRGCQVRTTNYSSCVGEFLEHNTEATSLLLSGQMARKASSSYGSCAPPRKTETSSRLAVNHFYRRSAEATVGAESSWY